VWVGNADGEGRPGLTGSEAAAPLMFDIFAQLNLSTEWFPIPRLETREIVVCKASGHRASSLCTDTDTTAVPVSGLKTVQCPYHKIIHLSADHKFQVHDECASLTQMKHVNWFVLPPVQAFYYRNAHTGYKHLPAFRPGCADNEAQAVMDMVYPKNNTRLLIPRELDGQAGSSVFELAHRDPGSTVYWHLDGAYVGSTVNVHHMPLNPPYGKHTLTLVDENGMSLQRDFEVISKM
jgi:penicillin-binding protein 1C